MKTRKLFYQPCPSCGGFPVRRKVVQASGFGNGCRLACVNEQCQHQPTTECKRTWPEARLAWNKRQVVEPTFRIVARS